MKHMSWKIAAAGLLALQVGCVDAGSSIQILRNQAPDEGCVVPTSETALFYSRGVIDVAATRGYLFTPLIKNLAVTSATADRTAFVEGANVDLVFATDLYSEAELSSLKEQGLSFFRQSFSGNIDPGGVASFAFEIIPKGMLDSLAGKISAGETTQVVAEVEVIGRQAGGDVSSSVFRYPIDVCNGCLVNNLGSCSTLESDATNTGGACQSLQDGIVDCCDDNGTQVCPAIKKSPSE